MNWKNRLTNYNFWISMFSATLLILQALKIKFDFAYINEIFTAVLGLLVVIGIISDPTKTAVKTQDTTINSNVKEETKDSNKQETTLPINAKDESDNENLQSDFQTIVNALKQQTAEAIEDMRQNFVKQTEALNSKTTLDIQNFHPEQTDSLETTKQENVEKIEEENPDNKENTEIAENTEIISPVVAEIDNPYLM